MATRTRRGNTIVANQIHVDAENRSKGVKRQPGGSPQEKAPAKKTRTAFGDITNRDNAKQQNNKGVGKKVLKPKKAGGGVKQIIAVPKQSSRAPQQGSQQTGQQLTSSQQSVDMSWDIIELSQDSNSSSSQDSVISSQNSVCENEVDMMNEKNLRLSQRPAPEVEWIDIDAEHMADPYQCSLYAHHIFQYYKTREERFHLDDYMSWQSDLSSSMRAILVDWLVEVQENFELNHETLYLAVKLTDHYLAKVATRKDRLQLVGATAMFIASKFDERLPPVLDDFLYICDDAYKREELIAMEMSILRAIDFDLGIPLSYRYLRRYAKCARVDMETLTLGRYILEMSLMDYHFCRQSDATLAAATLRLAMRMKDNQQWDATTVHYTGCTAEDVEENVKRLNAMISGESNKQLTTIRTKYSHKVFHEVAKIPALDLSESL